MGKVKGAFRLGTTLTLEIPNWYNKVNVWTGSTVRELAAILANIETGKNVPTAELIVKIANYFVTLDQLVTDKIDLD